MRTRTVVTRVTRTRYQCSVCKRWDSSKERTQQCEKLPVEKKFFKVGDVITGFERFASGGSKVYHPHARVVAITLEARDQNGLCDFEDVAHRWLYELRWKCPARLCQCKGDEKDMHSDLYVYGALKRPYASGEYHPSVLRRVRLRSGSAR